jgi:tRNA (cytidine56-2'-O)-methyltransferase
MAEANSTAELITTSIEHSSMIVEVLRLGHRLPRDERISTHVALVARAFGARSVAYSGQHDSGLEESVRRICERWGGGADGVDFSISYEKAAAAFIKGRKREGFVIVHLTMYGMPLMTKLGDILTREKILLVVGSEAVPPEIYQLADHNISVTGQPHSEVAALAIALDRLMGGAELGERGFGGGIRIIPSERGKNVVER